MRYAYGMGKYGVNYSIPPSALPSGMLADGCNVLPNDAGLLTGRGGTLALNNAAVSSAITGLFEYRSGSTVATLCSYDTKLAAYDDATDVFIDYITGLTAGKKTQWCNFAGKAISVNEGSDPPQYFDGTTGGALAGTPPNGKTICEWSSRVWLGGDSTNVALLTGSCLSNPLDWSTGSSATGIVQQYIGDTKDPITGIFGFFDWLLIGKRNQLFKLMGTPPTDATKLAVYPVYDERGGTVGFTSPWAIAQVGKDCIFLDGFDIKRLSAVDTYGDVETASIIPHFREYLKSVADGDLLQYSQFFHYKTKQQIWVSVPTSATTHYVFAIDYRFEGSADSNSTSVIYSVFPMSGLEITSFAGIRNGSVDDMYAGFEDGTVRQLECATNDDSATAISRYFTVVISGLDQEVQGGNEYRKQFHQLATYIKPTESTLTMTPSYALDLLDDTQIRTGTYTDLTAEVVSGWTGTGVKRKNIRLFGVNGKALALKWTHEKVGENFVFQPSSVDYEYKQKTEIV